MSDELFLSSYEYDCSLDVSLTGGFSAVLLTGVLSLLELVILSTLLLTEAFVLASALLLSDLSVLFTETLTLTFPEFLL